MASPKVRGSFGETLGLLAGPCMAAGGGEVGWSVMVDSKGCEREVETECKFDVCEDHERKVAGVRDVGWRIGCEKVWN